MFPIEINEKEHQLLDVSESIYAKLEELIRELRPMPAFFNPTNSTNDNIRRIFTRNGNEVTMGYQLVEEDPSDESDYPIDIDEEVGNYFSQTLFDDHEEINTNKDISLDFCLESDIIYNLLTERSIGMSGFPLRVTAPTIEICEESLNSRNVGGTGHSEI